MKITRTFYWPYQICAAVVNIEGKPTQLTYHKNVITGDIGSEVYTGENYIPESKDRSYSRNYVNEQLITDLPVKYRDTVDKLIEDHNKFENWEGIKNTAKTLADE